MSELGLRIISAIVLLAIALPLIWIGGTPFLLMCVGLSLLLAYEMYRIVFSGRETMPVNKGAWMLGGLVYVAIPIICLPLIRNVPHPEGLFLLLLLFVSVWMTDIAAYFAGRHFGGPKLLPAVSPKKTWSGALGGLSGAVLVCAMAAIFIDGASSLLVGLGAAVLSIFSQAGDLFESWIKRRFAVKDSSNLIPGHGGFLDRVDGLLIAAIPMALYVLFTAK